MPMLIANDPEHLRAIAARTFIDCNRSSSPADRIGAIKLYIVTPSQVLARRFHENLTLWGWRYVRTAPDDEAAHCDISLETPHQIAHAFATTAVNLLAHAHAAEQSLRRHNRAYEGRILSIPAIQMEALWVHTPEPRIPDRFYGLPLSQPAWPDRRFLKIARERSAALRS